MEEAERCHRSGCVAVYKASSFVRAALWWMTQLCPVMTLDNTVDEEAVEEDAIEDARCCHRRTSTVMATL